MAYGHTHSDVGDESDCERGFCFPSSDTIQGAIDFLAELGVKATWSHTGGGVMALLVEDPLDEQTVDRAVLTFGTASGENWGWSDMNGDDWGEWTDLPALCDGEELGFRIYTIIVDRKWKRAQELKERAKRNRIGAYQVGILVETRVMAVSEEDAGTLARKLVESVDVKGADVSVAYATLEGNG